MLIDYRQMHKAGSTQLSLQTTSHCTLLFIYNAIMCISFVNGASNVNTSVAAALMHEAPGNGFVHAAPVKDLAAIAVSSETDIAGLQLNVSWSLPTEGRSPKDLTLEVTSFQDPECPSFKCYQTMTNNTTWQLAPLKPSLVHEEAECMIRPGCRYQVRVQSNPYNGVDAAEMNYTVPDCVGLACSCRHRIALPRVGVNVQQVGADLINITWNLKHEYKGNISLPDGVQMSHFLIRLGEQIVLTTHDAQPWFKLLKEVNVSISQREKLLQAELLPGLLYIARVRIGDSMGCLGPEGNATISVKTIVANTEDHSKYSTILLAFISLLIISVVIAGVLSRCASPWLKRKFGGGTLRTLHHVTWSTRESQDNKLDRLIGMNGQMERNILYVEKEIEDSRILGEVDSFEIWHSRLTLGREVGKGAFGRVFLATAEAINGVPGKQTVAVKKLKKTANTDEVDEFLSEIAMLKRVGHHRNIVALLGCCTLRQPYCMVMEYVPCGDLLQYLRALRAQYEAISRPNDPSRQSKYIELLQTGGSDASYIQPETSHRPSVADTETTTLSASSVSGHATSASSSSSCSVSIIGSATTSEPIKTLDCVLDHKELQNFALQIAKGMKHLEEKQITHRDLAARNVLIDENKTLKISDFGLSRSGIYVNTKQKKVPLRWLALESIRDNLYSSKSDVWAYAIVLWEIGTLGGFPYPSVSNHELLGYLVSGGRLERPHNISRELHSLMTHCWAASPDDRPSFAQIVEALHATKHKVYVDFNILTPDHAFPPTEGDKT